MDKNKLQDIKSQLDKVLGDEDKELLKDVIAELRIQNKQSNEILNKLIASSTLGEKQKGLLVELIEKVADIKLTIPDVQKVEVTNPAEPITEIKVSNFPEPVRSVEVTNFPEQKPFPKSIKVSNLDEINIPEMIKLEKPEWFKQLSKDDIFEVLVDLITAINKGDGIKVDLDKYRDPKKPLATRLSGGKEFYNAVTEVINSYSGGSGTTTSTTPTTTVETYKTNDVDEADGSITYVGAESSTGKWYVKRLDESANPMLIDHATIANNPTVTSYVDAWAVRATTLVYGSYNEAF